MVETRYYCDRCRKQLFIEDPLPFPVARFKTYVSYARVTIRRQHDVFHTEDSKMICDDCYQSYKEWFKNGEENWNYERKTSGEGRVQED